jgi:hypothetical protein
LLYFRDAADMSVVLPAHADRVKVSDPTYGQFQQWQPKLPQRLNQYLVELSDAVFCMANPMTLIPDSKDGKNTRALVTDCPVAYTQTSGFCVAKNSYGLPPVVRFPSTAEGYSTIAANIPWLVNQSPGAAQVPAQLCLGRPRLRLRQPEKGTNMNQHQQPFGVQQAAFGAPASNPYLIGPSDDTPISDNTFNKEPLPEGTYSFTVHKAEEDNSKPGRASAKLQFRGDGNASGYTVFANHCVQSHEKSDVARRGRSLLWELMRACGFSSMQHFSAVVGRKVQIKVTVTEERVDKNTGKVWRPSNMVVEYFRADGMKIRDNPNQSQVAPPPTHAYPTNGQPTSAPAAAAQPWMSNPVPNGAVLGAPASQGLPWTSGRPN